MLLQNPLAIMRDVENPTRRAIGLRESIYQLIIGPAELMHRVYNHYKG
jgi:hypothetical protein